MVFSGDKQMAGENTICDLSEDVMVHVSGDDAEAFLQGQFSNDLLALGIPGSQLNTWSSPKGRVLALFRIVRDTDGYLIKMPAELAEPILKRLKMFVLRAKVTLQIRSDLVCLGVSGEKVAGGLQQFVPTVPVSVDETSQAQGATVYRVRGDTKRYEVITTVATAVKLWDHFKEFCQAGSDSVWRLQNIDAGLPSIGASTTDAFVLQMLNLDHLNGVSFKKGCFPGQEVVARMHYLGKLKRRMFRARGSLPDGAGLPLPGADVFNQDVGSPVGKIVDACAVGDGTFRMLLVNAIAATEQPLFLDKEATRQIELLDLPYSIEAG